MKMEAVELDNTVAANVATDAVAIPEGTDAAVARGGLRKATKRVDFAKWRFDKLSA